MTRPAFASWFGPETMTKHRQLPKSRSRSVEAADAPPGLREADRAAVKLLRESGKPVLYAANKADSPRADAEAFELYRLGVQTVSPVSALHGRGIGGLEAALVALLPDPAESDVSE